MEVGADWLCRWRIECVARSDEGEDSARTEFCQRFDKEVVVDRAGEKPLAWATSLIVTILTFPLCGFTGLDSSAAIIILSAVT